MTSPRHDSAVDPEAEQEVDFGRYWRAIAARWWLPVGGLVAGLVIGYLVSLGTHSSTYKATAQVYLGQPLAPGGAAPVGSAPTSLGLVSNFVTAESTIRKVASQVGLKPGRLRGHVTTKPITGITGAKVGTPAPLLAITVSGAAPAKVAAAANALGDLVIKQVAPYQTAKIQSLRDQLAYDNAQLKAIAARLDSARATQASVLRDKSIGGTDKLVALANLNSVITLALQQQNTISLDRFTVRQQLSLARDIEVGRIVAQASATKTAGANSRTGAAVGGLIGLIIGILAALLWDPITRRRSEA
jgi:capsular polysaccharide biosynthesis protein